MECIRATVNAAASAFESGGSWPRSSCATALNADGPRARIRQQPAGGRGRLRLTGAQLLRSFESSRAAPLLLQPVRVTDIQSHEAKPGVLRVRAGLINEPLAARPGMHIYVGSAASWWTVGDDLPRFEAGVVQSERTDAD